MVAPAKSGPMNMTSIVTSTENEGQSFQRHLSPECKRRGRRPESPPSLTLRALMELAIFNWLLDKGFRFDHDGGSTPCQPEISESGCWPRSLIQQGQFHHREQQGNSPRHPPPTPH